MNGTRLLLENIYYQKQDDWGKGYIYIVGDRIKDIGVEPPAIYEFSEYVRDHEYLSLALHGMSIVSELTIRPLITVDESIDELLSMLSKNDLEKIAKNTLYNLIRNGITLPIIDDPYPEIVQRVLVSWQIHGILITREPLKSKHKLIHNIIDDNEYLYYNDKLLGRREEVICSPQDTREKCLFIEITGLPIYNYGCILNLTRNKKKLFNAYKLIGLDNGLIEKEALADLVIYDLDNPTKNILIPRDPYSLLSTGIVPDTIIVGGDILVEKNEAIGIEPTSIGSILREVSIH